LINAVGDKRAVAVADEGPSPLRDTKPVEKQGSSSAVPSNPDSRLGRKASPLAQGWDRMDAVIVGIDVAKDKLDVAVRPSGERFVVSRTDAGIEELSDRLRELGAAVVGLEATGGYETVVAASLSAAGLPVVVVNPAQVRAFANALGKRAKTDPIDAAVIAHFIEATKPSIRPLPDEATRQLSDLVSRRSQIQAMIVAEQQRKKHRPNKRMSASIERLLAALQRELSDLDGQIREAIKASPVWREKDELLQSVPSIGPAHHRPIAGRDAGTRLARSPPDRRARGPGAVDAPIRPMEGQKLHRRRPRRRAQRALHGGSGRGQA
jgi:transposase